MKKKIYETPELEITKLNSSDIISTSPSYSPDQVDKNGDEEPMEF